MMKAKIVGMTTDLVEAGAAEHPKKIEAGWSVQIAVMEIDPGVTRENIADAYRDGILFDVTPAAS